MDKPRPFCTAVALISAEGWMYTLNADSDKCRITYGWCWEHMSREVKRVNP